ncbi:hypothetical protein K1F50_12995 [Muricauda oceani]|uniref:Uncharacterized protein n=1 Tax=Flagellimonas oceani TaxID=2698672 RepID=A0A6G7IZU3_9FLAO|nr:hypothetical protein [Allomuricauda oceani]MBW8243721.1 hypothetical protein [Allomuricauda oceani]QII43920.1 hypothetical protein GVT53_04260 [Allomuricauda oceani]
MEAPQNLQGTNQVMQYIPQLLNVHISNGIVYNYPDPMLYLDMDYHELFV